MSSIDLEDALTGEMVNKAAAINRIGANRMRVRLAGFWDMIKPSSFYYDVIFPLNFIIIIFINKWHFC